LEIGFFLSFTINYNAAASLSNILTFWRVLQYQGTKLENARAAENGVVNPIRD